MINWIFHTSGLDDASGAWYLFWSGICGNIAIIGAAITYLRHHNCHAQHCWRLGMHEVEGTEYKTCRKHHPTLRKKRSVPIETIHTAHRLGQL